MINRLEHKTSRAHVSIEISRDGRNVAIFHVRKSAKGDPSPIAEFDITVVWDMLRDALVVNDIEPITEPGLFRRKGEAAAGILFTNKIYSKKE